MLHQNAPLAARVSELKQRSDRVTKQKARKRRRLQHSGTIEYGEGSASVAAEASTVPGPSKKSRRSVDPRHAQSGTRRYGKCGETGHDA
jgi:hypothetical protein